MLLVLDWPGSVVIQLVKQENGSGLVLAEVRKRGFKSAAWIESDTCRGKPEFGMRIYLKRF